MIETYPRSATAYFSLGEEYAALGQYETAAEMTAKAQELGPGEVPAYSNLTGYQLALQRFGEARATVDREGARHGWLHVSPSALCDGISWWRFLSYGGTAAMAHIAP